MGALKPATISSKSARVLSGTAKTWFCPNCGGRRGTRVPDCNGGAGRGAGDKRVRLTGAREGVGAWDVLLLGEGEKCGGSGAGAEE